MKSYFKMLIAVGVFAISLFGVQGVAQAEPMLSSWYGPGFEGSPTASGEPYNYGDRTAAHPYLPLGTELEVCYASCTEVTVNDRGPHAGGRELDLSQAAAEDIGLTGAGVDTVDVEVVD